MALGVPPRDLVEDLVIYPLTGYAAARALPLPPLVPDVGPILAGRTSMGQYVTALRGGLRFYFPLAALVVATSVLVAAARAASRGSAADEARQVAFVCVIGASLLPYAWVRSDIAHIVPAWFPALLLFAWLIHRLPERGRLRAAGVALAAAWSLVFVWGGLVAKAEALREAIGGSAGVALDPPRGAHIVAGPEAGPMQAAIRYVRAAVPPDEPIFVGNARHDSLVLNDVMFYFLAERRSATKYHELVPGVATTAAIQTRIVQDLERRRVRYVVLRADPGYVPGAGADVLDRFIRERFVPLESFGAYGVWRRRDERP
jgi:hypothetical protein